uniref:Transmembrane protein n=1 Tax=Heterorhabditis bacteriophora TaxID=37862 RepID=A0A1I7WFC6_HETBA
MTNLSKNMKNDHKNIPRAIKRLLFLKFYASFYYILCHNVLLILQIIYICFQRYRLLKCFVIADMREKKLRELVRNFYFISLNRSMKLLDSFNRNSEVSYLYFGLKYI